MSDKIKMWQIATGQTSNGGHFLYGVDFDGQVYFYQDDEQGWVKLTMLVKEEPR